MAGDEDQKSGHRCDCGDRKITGCPTPPLLLKALPCCSLSLLSPHLPFSLPIFQSSSFTPSSLSFLPLVLETQDHLSPPRIHLLTKRNAVTVIWFIRDLGGDASQSSVAPKWVSAGHRGPFGDTWRKGDTNPGSP